MQNPGENELLELDMSIVERNFCDVLHRINIASSDEGKYVSNDGNILTVTEDGVPIRKLFIGNLAERTTYKDLATLFSKYGNVESCYVRRNFKKSNYAFVTFSDVNDAMRAREDGNWKGIRLHNRDLRVMPADSWHQPDNMENLHYNITEDCDQGYIQDDISSNCIHRLNDDCLMHIFLYLPIADKVRIERVCKRWRAVSQESWCAVKRLDLSCVTWGLSPTSKQSAIDTVTLRKVLLRCGKFLTEINLSQIYHRLSQSTLTIVSKLCPNLQTIDITALTVSTSGINSLTKYCHDITRFSLGPSTHACDTDLKLLFQTNQKLKYLKLVNCQLSGSCLSHLPADTMEEMILDKCKDVNEPYLLQAVTKLVNLESLSIIQCVSIPNNVMKAVSMHCQKLKTLEIYGFFVLPPTEDILDATQLVNLEVLNVSRNGIVTDIFLRTISAKCQQLTYVNISGCPFVTNAGLAAIATLPKLENLVMSYLYHVTDSGLQNMYNLKKLECRECRIGDEGVSNLIKSSPRLELLDLSGCVRITNETLQSAAVATNCRTNNIVLKIFIGGTAVDLDLFWNVSPFLQIVNVDLSDSVDFGITFHNHNAVDYVEDS